jgi:phage shock protein B
MEDFVPIFAIFTLFIAFPMVILHYVTQWKKTRGLSSEDQLLLQQLFSSAQRLEQRINNLERVLDTNRESQS